MKKTIILSGALLLSLSAFTANAQQLPNVGFDSWKGTCGKTTWTSTMKTDGGFTRPGDEPTGWCGSSVKPFNSNLTSSIRCSKVTENGNTYVKVDNASILGNTIPGYMTAAQPWVFVGGTGWANAASYASGGDGGSHSSVAFAFRPDALTLKYQKTGSETSHIIAMLWTGTFKSFVPSSCDKNGNQTFGTELEDVDRVVIGRQDDDKVLQKGTLVASLDEEIKTEVKSWTTVVLPLNYKTTTVAPTKMNVVLAASDYWTRANLQGGTSLLVDDVDFVYYSTLTALKAGGKTIALQDGVYNYTVAGKMPSADAVVATCKSQFANAAVTVDAENYQVKVVVTNQGGKDIDGQTQHTYVLQYTAPTEQVYTGILNVEMMGEDVIANAEKSVTIKYYNDNTCDFLLPDFEFMDSSLGDISVPDVKVTEDADGVKMFTDGEVEAMELGGGAIVAHVVLDGGTITSAGVINMPITVGWMMDYPDDTTEVPINVLFSSDEQVWVSESGYYYVVKGDDYQHPLTEHQPTMLKSVKHGDLNGIFYTLSLEGVQASGINFGNMAVAGLDNSEEVYSGTDDAVALAGGKTASVTVSGGKVAEADKYELKFATTVDGELYNIVYTTVDVSASVGSVEAAEATVVGGEGVILVGGFEGRVDVYTVDGSKVATATANGEAQIKLAAGLYVVRAGERVAKVVVK